MADRIAGDPFDNVRDVFEGMSQIAAEPTDVTYQEVTEAGLSAIWASSRHPYRRVGPDGNEHPAGQMPTRTNTRDRARVSRTLH